MPADQDLDGPGFKHATIREIYRQVQEPNTRVSAPALHLSAEYLKLFTTEAVHRAAEIAQLEKDEEEQAKNGGKGDKGKGKNSKGNQPSSEFNDSPAVLETKHLEKVLAGMLLDF
ncbi:hypothetical protein JCM5350_001347 [Sporobolomyces pararoseus]